jgi:hypothetical protein
MMSHNTTRGEALPCELVHLLESHDEWASERVTGSGLNLLGYSYECYRLRPENCTLEGCRSEFHGPTPTWNWRQEWKWRDNVMLDGASLRAVDRGMDSGLFGSYPYGDGSNRETV